MSKFFQSLEEEKIESRKKSAHISGRSQEKLSKKEQKMKEFRGKVEEVSGSEKNFDKLFKRLMNEARKYAPYFENNEVPRFLSEFFATPRVTSSRQMSAQAHEFLSSFLKPQAVCIEKKEVKKGTLETVMTIDNDKEREKALVNLLSRGGCDEESCCEVLVALYSIYSRFQSPDKMIETLESILRYMELDNPFVRIVKKNLDIYLGKIYDLMGDELFGRYSSLLASLERFNKDAVQKRLLELQFFRMKNSVENDHPQFALLFLVRNEDWNNALTYYLSHGNVFDDTKVSILILSEFARLAAKNGEFGLAFEIFCRCDSTSLVSLKTEIYSLCTILNDDLVGNQYFQSFLDIFKTFDANYLVLRSMDPVMEICRAFYLLNMCDHLGASRIIIEVSGFECEDAMLGSALKIFERQ